MSSVLFISIFSFQLLFCGSLCETRVDRSLKPIPTNITTCEAAGYTGLTCLNNGTCYAYYEGVSWTYSCACDNAYSGDSCQYRGRPLQKFKTPITVSPPAYTQTIVGDSKNIYTIVGCSLVSYQMNSNGLLIGDGYTNSINSSIRLSKSCDDEDLVASALRDNIFSYVDAVYSQSSLSLAGTNPLRSATVTIPLGYFPGGLAFDKYDYIWVNTNYPSMSTSVSVYNSISGKLAATLIKGGDAGKNGSNGFGIAVTDDDLLFMADNIFDIAIYQIERDSDHIPIQINFVRAVALSQCQPQHFIYGMTTDKWGQVVAACDSLVYIITPAGDVQVINAIAVPSDQPWNAIWSSPVTGYLYMTSCCDNEFYVQQYMSY